MQARQAGAPADFKPVNYELFMFLVSAVSVVNTFLVFLPLAEIITQVALAVDLFLMPLFLLDFGYRVVTSRPRSGPSSGLPTRLGVTVPTSPGPVTGR